MHESELVDRLKKGDEAAYRLFVDSHQSSVLNCCFRVVADRVAAEDLTQEVFIEVHRSIRQFRSESKLSTWVYRIAMTKSLDHLKALRRKKRFGVLKGLLPTDPDAVSALPSDLPSPHQVLEQEERKRVLAWAIDLLPDNQRVAFTLSKYDALSCQEIADVLNTTVPAIESLIFRAKANLRNRLSTHYKDHL
jgi:RNA polymerase sigma-70 factor (ECF subfamily)